MAAKCPFCRAELLKDKIYHVCLNCECCFYFSNSKKILVINDIQIDDHRIKMGVELGGSD